MVDDIAGTGVLVEAVSTQRREGRVRGFVRRLLKVRLAGFGLTVILFFLAMAILAPLIAPYDPVMADQAHGLENPSLAHPFGTDLYGRDTLSRVMYGSQISLQVGITAVGLAIIVGIPFGLVAGYRGGWIDAVIMRVMDGLYAFPALILALAIVAVLGPGAIQVTTAIGIVNIPLFARLIRASVLSIRELDYVMAARAMGAGDTRILLRHILPNSLAPIIVQATLGLAWAIIVEASLSFVGVGIAPPTPTWGMMLNDGFQYLEDVPWLSIFPGAAIFLLVLAFNFVGDALRDVLDPRLGRALGLR